MKNTIKFLGIIALVAVIGLGVITCSDGDDGTTNNITTPSGGKTLVSIAVTPPTKTRYNIGEDLDLTGMVVKATYSDDTTEPVTDYKTSGYNKNKRGNQTITVSYGGKTAAFSVNVIDPSLPAVATPTASPGAGTYSMAQTVTLTTETAGAKIYYTTDGTEPTEASSEYADGNPIDINKKTTIKAFAVKDDMNDSDVLTEEYILTFAAAPALTLEPDSAKITYTWTASDPAADSYDVYWKAGNNLSAAEVKTGTKVAEAISGGEITGLTNGTAYSVIVTANKAGFSGVDSAVQTATPASVYTITGSGAAFTATRADAIVGTANQPIQTVIDAIRTHANGDDCIIHFGDGDVLDIGTASVSFNNTGGTWGLVTLTGKITSAESQIRSGTIAIADSVSVTSMADIKNTSSGYDGIAVYNASTGTVTISGGTVENTGDGSAVNNNFGKITVSGSAKVTSKNMVDNRGTIYNHGGTLTISGGTVENIASGPAVYTDDSGTVTISGGTIENTAANGGKAVSSSSSGAVTISGGTVSARTGMAVYNSSTGKITVSGTALVTSANTNILNQGTIHLADSGTATNARLEIQGGTVENTAATTGNAVYNASTGAVTISGGTVSAMGSSGGYAVCNVSTGAVTMSGGTVSAMGSSGFAVYSSSGTVTISGGTVSATSGRAVSSSGTVTISGGTVSATSGRAVEIGIWYNTSSTGTVTISGGEVKATSGYAIYNTSSRSSAVTISGGTVQAETGYAVYNASTGKITVSETALVSSANTNAAQGTIHLADNETDTAVRLEIQGGTVENTAANGNTIRNDSTGAVIISGGTVSATTRYAVYNCSTGGVYISGGTVSTTSGVTVYNVSTGTVTISGGTVQAATGYAVYNYSTGKITVLGTTTKVSSANTSAISGTIHLANSGTDDAVRLEIQGGTVENTSATTGNAVYNASTGAVTMSGGTVSVTGTSARAIHNNSTGALTISDGTVSATGASGYSVYNASGGTVTITVPPAVIVGSRYP